MAGKEIAVKNGNKLVEAVAEIGKALGLDVIKQYRVSRRIWGAKRSIDVVLIQPETRKTLGIECKYQETSGTAEEKLPATIQDILSWPIPGLLVFYGKGFTENIKSYVISTGKAVELTDLEPWLRLFFGIDVEKGSEIVTIKGDKIVINSR